MTDMTVEEAMAKYGPKKLTSDDLLVFDDPHYNRKDVVIVTSPLRSSRSRSTTRCTP